MQRRDEKDVGLSNGSCSSIRLKRSNMCIYGSGGVDTTALYDAFQRARTKLSVIESSSILAVPQALRDRQSIRWAAGPKGYMARAKMLCTCAVLTWDKCG